MEANLAYDPRRHASQTRYAYDQLARAWSADTDDGPFNGALERPALRALLPRPLRGCRILDAGCGAGAHSSWLLNEGADVVGVDFSVEMVRRAEERCAGQGKFYIADLAAPLPAEFGTFDGIICSLTLHYLKDWAVPLRSFTSVLDAGGWIVISLDHPLGTPRPDRGNYFETTLVSGRWHKQGVSVTQRFWRRPLAAVVDAFAEAGLYIEKVAEPRPDRAALDRWPAELSNADASPAFLLYRLRVRE